MGSFSSTRESDLATRMIDELYRPEITPLADALGAVGLTPSDITAVIVSHLHFDHCGQLNLIAAPVYLQAEEHEAAQSPGYTVPDWAAIPEDRLRLVRGDEEIAEGIGLLSTPGHTPGHQSVVIEAAGRTGRDCSAVRLPSRRAAKRPTCHVESP